MMKKLMLVSSLVIALSSVNQAQAVSKKLILGLTIVGLAGVLIYKYYVQEQANAKDQTPASVEDEAVLKRS